MYKKLVASQAYCESKPCQDRWINRPTVSQRFDKTWSRAEVPEISMGTQMLCSVSPMSASLPSLISPWGWKNPCDRHQVVATATSAQPMGAQHFAGANLPKMLWARCISSVILASS